MSARVLVVVSLLLAPQVTVSTQITPELVRQRTEREWDVKAGEDADASAAADAGARHRPLVDPKPRDAPDPALELLAATASPLVRPSKRLPLLRLRDDAPLETTAVGTHLTGHLRRFYDTVVPYGEEGLAPHLREYLDARDPSRIAINQSRTISMADGLTAELKDYLVDAFPDYQDRLVSSEPLLVEYVSTRTDREHAIQREASAATFAILERALSNEVITPAGRACSTSTTGSPPSGSGRPSSSTSRPRSTSSAAVSGRSTTRTTRSSSGAISCTSTSACAAPVSSPTSRRWRMSCVTARPRRRRVCGRCSTRQGGWPTSSARRCGSVARYRDQDRRRVPGAGRRIDSLVYSHVQGNRVPRCGGVDDLRLARPLRRITQGFRSGPASGSRSSSRSPRPYPNGTGSR